MDQSILRVMPLLVQAAAVLGRRSFNVSVKTLLSQIAYAREFFPVAENAAGREGTEVDLLLHRIDSTRSHLRSIADIISHESRALATELAAIADAAHALAEDGADGQVYRRRWKAKP